MRTLYYNGHIHTIAKRNCMRMEEEEKYCAIGTQDDRITFLGTPSEDEWNQWDVHIDLEGAHVYPTMTDSHVHLLYTMILAASSFCLCKVTSQGIQPSNLAGVRERIREYCTSHPKQKIIVANQYIMSAMEEGRMPNRQELDEWTGGRCLIIYNIDGHSSSMSTALMKRLKLPIQGHDGCFSGPEHEFMQGKVTSLIASSVTPSVLAKGIAEFSNQCAHYGISRVCAMDGNGDVPKDRLTRMLAYLASKMDIDIRLFPQYMELDKAKWFEKYQSHPRAGGCGDWELDGSVGSHSAAFYEPFKDTGKKGHCYYEDRLIEEKVRYASNQKIQLSSHAIGEVAIDQIVDIYEKVLGDEKPMNQSEEKNKKQKPMCRIDHFEFPSRRAVEAVKNLPLAITIQPGFSWVDKRYLKSYEKYLPEKIIAKQIPLKELADAGVCLCGSSDSPVQSMNPWEQMLGMTEFYLPEQSLGRYQALETYTTNPSRMLDEEEVSGSLKVGKKADFFVMNQDYLWDSVETSGQYVVKYMIKDGKTYQEKKGTVLELIQMLFRRKKKL